jgi:predicted nucleotidyltransferase
MTGSKRAQKHRMTTLSEITRILEAEKAHLAERYGVKALGVFGSYVRGEQRPDSDLDLLLELERPAKISLIDLVELEMQLSELLGVKVDLVLQKNLRPRIGARIRAEVIPV